MRNAATYVILLLQLFAVKVSGQWIYSDTLKNEKGIIQWRKTVARTIDFSEKFNQRLLHLHDSQAKETTLQAVILEAVRNYAVKTSRIDSDFGPLLYVDSSAGGMGFDQNIDSFIYGLTLVEKWEFNADLGKMLVSPLWIGLCRRENHTKNTSPLFWIKYSDAVPIFRQLYLPDSQKKVTVISVFDLFEKRLFSSKIYATSSPDLMRLVTEEELQEPGRKKRRRKL